MAAGMLYCRLAVAVALGRQRILVVLKTQSLERDVFHVTARRGIARESHESGKHRRDDLRLRQVFARQRM